MAKETLLAWFDTATEYYKQVNSEDLKPGISKAIRDLGDEAVRSWGMTTPYGEPKAVELKIYRVEAKEGKLQNRYVCNLTVDLPYDRITDAQYEAEQAKILSALPKEFGKWLLQEAYDTGHSSGMEEVLSILRSLVSGFIEAFKAYQLRTGALK